MAMPRSPAAKSSTSGLTRGCSANEVSRWPLEVTIRAPGSSSVAERTTVVGPPTTAVWTPRSVVIGVSSSSVHFQTWSSVASSIGLAWNRMLPSLAAMTLRTWMSVGVTGSPSTARRRDPS